MAIKFLMNEVKQELEDKLIIEYGIRECMERDEFELYFPATYTI